MRELDYFPKVMPQSCVDEGGSWGEYIRNVNAEMSKAIHTDVSWPLDESLTSIPEDVLYAVIEYFHDQAQRPRTRSFHPWNGRWHYADHNKGVGRGRLSLEGERVARTVAGAHLRLDSKGPEKGRLIRNADFQLDELADELTPTSSRIGRQARRRRHPSLSSTFLDYGPAAGSHHPAGELPGEASTGVQVGRVRQG